jgi:hypothetical protein
LPRIGGGPGDATAICCGCEPAHPASIKLAHIAMEKKLARFK